MKNTNGDEPVLRDGNHFRQPLWSLWSYSDLLRMPLLNYLIALSMQERIGTSENLSLNCL